jgi:hypothetical protein
LLAQPLGRRARVLALRQKGIEFLKGLNMIPRFDRPLHADQEEVDVVFCQVFKAGRETGSFSIVHTFSGFTRDN